ERLPPRGAAAAERHPVAFVRHVPAHRHHADPAPQVDRAVRREYRGVPRGNRLGTAAVRALEGQRPGGTALGHLPARVGLRPLRVGPRSAPRSECARQPPDAVARVYAPPGTKLDGDPLGRELVDLLPDQWLAHTV